MAPTVLTGQAALIASRILSSKPSARHALERELLALPEFASLAYPVVAYLDPRTLVVFEDELEGEEIYSHIYIA